MSSCHFDIDNSNGATLELDSEIIGEILVSEQDPMMKIKMREYYSSNIYLIHLMAIVMFKYSCRHVFGAQYAVAGTAKR